MISSGTRNITRRSGGGRRGRTWGTRRSSSGPTSGSRCRASRTRPSRGTSRTSSATASRWRSFSSAPSLDPSSLPPGLSDSSGPLVSGPFSPSSLDLPQRGQARDDFEALGAGRWAGRAAGPGPTRNETKTRVFTLKVGT
eukprot:3446755-Pyramimonas_sp.AAC.1